jgi:hypothetical protein
VPVSHESCGGSGPAQLRQQQRVCNGTGKKKRRVWRQARLIQSKCQNLEMSVSWQDRMSHIATRILKRRMG